MLYLKIWIKGMHVWYDYMWSSNCKISFPAVHLWFSSGGRTFHQLSPSQSHCFWYIADDSAYKGLWKLCLITMPDDSCWNDLFITGINNQILLPLRKYIDRQMKYCKYFGKWIALISSFLLLLLFFFGGGGGWVGPRHLHNILHRRLDTCKEFVN